MRDIRISFMKSLPKNPRFLICRLSAVGDTVHTLPLANLIKQRWPESFVAWVVERGPAPFVQSCSAVDKTIVVPKGLRKAPKQLWHARQQLRELRIDVALDPQSLTKSATLAWLSGASRRIGFSAPIGREFAPWLNSELVTPRETHVVRRYLEVLRPLGVRATERDIAWNLPRNTESEVTIGGFLARSGSTGEFAVINPGAGWDSKVWPAERYGEIARRLPIHSFVTWSGDKERVWAETIVADSKGHATLMPPTSLLDFTTLVRQARLFIGSDTGPLHIAAAVGTPCVSMYGPTRPEVCGPFGTGHVVLQAYAEELGSLRKEAGRLSDAMLQITTQQVFSACERILSSGRGRSAA